jgi:class 3 adenylate cyclase
MERGATEEYYKYCLAGYAFGIIFSFLTYVGTRNPERKSLAIALLGVKSIAFSSYVLQYLRLTPANLTATGVPWLTARSMEWLFCTNTLLWVYRQVTCAYDPMFNTLFLNTAMVVTGWLGAVLKEPFATWMDTTSCLLYLPVIDHVMDMFQRAIDGKTPCRLDKRSLKFAKWSIWLSWWAFTVVYYVQKDKIVDIATGEAMYVCCDMIAKVLFTLIMINATQELSTAEQTDGLSATAAELESKMTNSDQLLEKMMPANVLEQLRNGQTEAEEYSSVTVFFSDIANFASLSSKASTKEMISVLNKLWLEYDIVAKRNGIYKVETIGDAYLGVAGCPKRCDEHAEQAVNFAIDLITMVKNFKSSLDEPIQIRIGLNSGPVTAGVLGDLNPHWCLVGDTVNTASRMESTSKAMHIHISESTYNLVKNRGFDISAPDVMNVKGKGTMSTFWVHGRK